MKMSARGRALLTKREGVRLHAYKDSVGIWTIGIGHTSAAGPPEVTPNLTITRAQCDAIFARDLVKYETAVDKAVQVPLQQHEFDALVSWCYNVGPGAMSGSSVIRLLNGRADRRHVADALLKWNRPPEIMGRRRSERAQFLTPYGKTDAATGAGGAVGGVVVGGGAGKAAQEAGASSNWATGIGIAVAAAVIIVTVIIIAKRRRGS